MDNGKGRVVRLAMSVLAGVGVLALVMGQSARANERRIPAAACHYVYDDAGRDVSSGSQVVVSGVGTTGLPTLTIVCPVPSDSTLEHGAVTLINVHGIMNSGSNSSSACAKDYGDAFITCGASMPWSSGFGGAAGLDTTGWTSNPFGFPFISSEVSPGTALYGVYLAN